MNRSPRKKNISAYITQKAVAARVGMSQGAVSYILSGRTDDYSERTRERVKRAAEELGYHPNRAAQAMRRGRSNTVVHLDYGGYTEAAERRAYYLGRFIHEAHWDYYVINSYWWPEKGPKMVSRILSLQPEGLIVVGSLQTQIDFRDLQRAGVAMVAIESAVPGVPLVRHNVRAAVAEMTRQCLAQGRTPMLLLRRVPADGSFHPWTTADRREGFLDALREVGITDVPEWTMDSSPAAAGAKHPAIIWRVLEPDSRVLFRGGEEAVRWLLKTKQLPDALVCMNDLYAIGVVGALTAAGVRIPEDIVVTGFDNLSYSTQESVSLTTAEQPHEAMCAEAVALLQKQIAAKKPLPELAATKVVLPCHIHWRRSLPREKIVTA